jgi:hypothetical protein
MRKWLLLVALLASQANAQEFTDAEVLNVETKQGLSSGILSNQLESDNHTVVTIQLGDMKISARTYSMGGGIVYLANHPEALIVGTTVKARLAKRGELQIEVPPKGKVLKFNVERMEKLAN